MTQARTAYVCADNAGHDGLRAYVRGIQSLTAFWAGWPHEALRYASSAPTSQRRLPAPRRSTYQRWLRGRMRRSVTRMGRGWPSSRRMPAATEAQQEIEAFCQVSSAALPH
jgi:hypothetical protein